MEKMIMCNLIFLRRLLGAFVLWLRYRWLWTWLVLKHITYSHWGQVV